MSLRLVVGVSDDCLDLAFRLSDILPAMHSDDEHLVVLYRMSLPHWSVEAMQTLVYLSLSSSFLFPSSI